mgnify:CR=1 FL=1
MDEYQWGARGKVSAGETIWSNWPEGSGSSPVAGGTEGGNGRERTSSGGPLHSTLLTDGPLFCATIAGCTVGYERHNLPDE